MLIGVAGLGRMGTAMAERLIATGHQVAAWNRSPRAAAGVRLLATPRALAEAVDVVLISVRDGDALQDVCGGQEGFCAAPLRGKLVIDTSTVAPQDSRRADIAIKAAGGRFVDGPVLGTVGPCVRGELVAMLGGSGSDLDEAEVVLAPLTRAIHRMGPVGSGAAAKLAVNLVMGSYWAALGDALALGSAHDLDLDRLLDIIAGGPAALAQLPAKRPVLDGRDVRVDFDLASYVKDLNTMLRAAGPGLRLPVAEGALRSFEEARSDGWGARDVVAVALHSAHRLKGNIRDDA